MRESSIASHPPSINSEQLHKHKPAPLDIIAETEYDKACLICTNCAVIPSHPVKQSITHSYRCPGTHARKCWSAPPRTKNHTFHLSVLPTVTTQVYETHSDHTHCLTCSPTLRQPVHTQSTKDSDEVSSGDEEVSTPDHILPHSFRSYDHRGCEPIYDSCEHFEMKRVRSGIHDHSKHGSTRLRAQSSDLTADLQSSSHLNKCGRTCELCYFKLRHPRCCLSTASNGHAYCSSSEFKFQSDMHHNDQDRNPMVPISHFAFPFIQHGCFSNFLTFKSPNSVRLTSEFTRLTSLSLLPQTVQLLFRMLLVPSPVKSLQVFSQLLQHVSSSLDSITECRLPWHTSIRKPSGRIFHGIFRTFSKNTLACNNHSRQHIGSRDERKGRIVNNLDRHQKFIHDWRSDVDCVPRRTYASVAASSSLFSGKTDSWLTPAEASRVGLDEHVDQERSHCIPSNIHTESSITSTVATNHKFSVVSVRTIREPIISRSYTCSTLEPVNTTSFMRHMSHVEHSKCSNLLPLPVKSTDPLQYNIVTSSTIPTTPVNGKPNYQRTAFSFVTPFREDPLSGRNSHFPLADTRAHDLMEHNRSVFVDLTGYNVTVSVERLPPVTNDCKRPSRQPDSKPFRPSSTNTPSRSLSTPLPLSSPPPPYSECSFPFSNVLPHTSNASACNPNFWQHCVGGITPYLHNSTAWHSQCDWCRPCMHSIPLSMPVQISSTNCLCESCFCQSAAVFPLTNPYPISWGWHPVSLNQSCPYSSLGTSVMNTYYTSSPCSDLCGYMNYGTGCEVSTTPRNSQYVYIPEPIRVSRSHDVYHALRTCLVPHYELRDYFNTAPPQRQWRKLEELSKDGFPFTLMCYNLLSPSYATSNMFPYCPSWALSWDYRRRFILDEIRLYHANIICLQEVETDQFEEVFKPELEKLKYDGVFLPKSRRRTMDMKDCRKVDGCAIFWQVEKFEKVHEFHHEFMYSCSNMCENPTPLMVNRVMTRDNVALGVIFKTKSLPGAETIGGRQFCVTTGHIHWDPEHSDVKMIQTILWTAELWAYIDQFLTGSRNGSDGSGSTVNVGTPNPVGNKIPPPSPSSPAANMPVILCGDLNSLPDSGVIEFLMRGSLPKTHSDFLNNGFEYMFENWRLLEKWAVDGDTLRHRFTFDRAYRESQGMRMTNYTYDFKGMIDYVLYSRQHFRLLGSLDQIDESWFVDRKILGCPHAHIPSDHFALLVELELKPTPQLSSATRMDITSHTNHTIDLSTESHVPSSLCSSPSPTIGLTNHKIDNSASLMEFSEDINATNLGMTMRNRNR